MHARPRTPSVRRYVLAATATALVLALCGGGGWYLHQRNHTTTFGLADALHSLRSDGRAPATGGPQAERATGAGHVVAPAVEATPPLTRPVDTTAPAAPPMTRSQAASPPAAAVAAPFEVPAAGVYAYATDGYDAISMGSRHAYPSETFAVLQHDGGCGWEVEHHVVDQHVDHVARCSRPGDVLRISDASRVTFFGQTDGLSYACDPGTAMLADATCTAGDGSQARYHATVVDRPTISVGGVATPSIHVVLDITMTGRARGSARNQLWLDAATGLILHQIRDVDTLGRAAFGDVRYTEHAEFTLKSLTPQT